MLKNGKKVAVILGGGTSGPPLSEQFCDLEDWFTVSIAPASDSGGNSGELRDTHGILPPGDVRRFLIAHSNDEEQSDLRDIFNFRFPNNAPRLAGEVGGNILATICEKLWGRTEGVRRFSRLLRIRGEVYYASTQDTHLVAELSDGTILRGEKAIDLRPVEDERTINRVWLEPEVIFNISLQERLKQADVIVLAPGDFYTSLMAILLVTFMLDSLNNSRACIVLVVSLMTKKAETHGYSALTFVEKLREYGLRRLSAVLINKQPIPKRLRKLYWEKDRSKPVRFGKHIRRRLRAQGLEVVTGNYLSREALKTQLIRHDPKRVVERILDICE